MSAPDDAASATSAPPGSRPRLVWVTIGVALAVIVIDQVTKALAVAELKPRILSGQGPIEVLGPILKLTYTENTGAAFGMGTGFTWIFALIAAVVAVVILRTATRIGSVAWSIALGGLLGGAVGNLIDRLTRPPGIGQGYVVDFLELPNWPVFNVADMSIVGSAILMVILTIRGVELSGSRRVSDARPS